MQEFLTGDIWNKIDNLTRTENNKVLCISYVTASTVNLSDGDILICDASKHAIECGQTSAAILEHYLRQGVSIFSNGQLHSKLLMTDNLLAVGSSNLSFNSAEYLIESAIITSDKSLIAQSNAFIHNLIKESIQLNEDAIRKSLALKVLRKRAKHYKQSPTRKMQFEKRCWYIPVYPLSDRSYNAISSDVEKTTRTVSKKQGIIKDNIGFIRWGANSKFARNVLPGQQIVMKYANKEKTRSYIYPPVTVLEKKIVGRHVHLYYDDSDIEDYKISWSKFKLYCNDLELEKQYVNRTMTMTDNDVKKIRSLFPYLTRVTKKSAV